ncbi:MAG: M14 family zinc carboxypeptidase [Bacteroidia bacterium]
MKQLFFVTIFIFVTLISFAQKQNYSRAKIFLNDKDKTLNSLAALGLAVDHGEYKKNTYFISDFSDQEIAKAKENGFVVEILIQDVSAHYKNQNKESASKKKEKSVGGSPDRSSSCATSAIIATPTNFQLGTMGGFYTYTELLAILDNMANQFPNLITVKQQIGSSTSVEGRPIYWLKISDNPSVDETEPEILYTALHHAREAASISQMVFYMYYLLENYGSNPEITALVNNTEMYFIPCVNPDGYVYNETTDPNGGGMWRKNRRDNNDGSWGVDLNRNYGYQWGYDNFGSSPTSNDDTYRGPSAFSEPETQAVKAFCELHNFKMALNYHSYSDMLIYPWGYIGNFYTPDSAVFVNHSMLMTSQNNYLFGTGNQTVGYNTNGDSDDWCYGEQNTKPKILSMTPEVGSSNDGFWPTQERIIPICEDNLWQNIYAAQLIGKYADAKDLSSQIINTTTGFINYSIQRLGLDSPAVYTVSIIPLDSWITSVGAPKTYSTMALLETNLDSISYTLNSSIVAGQSFKFVIRVNNGLYDTNDTITKFYGQTVPVFSNSASSMAGYTSFSGNWNTSTIYYVSSPTSITDSPNGNYSDNTNKLLKLNTPIDLSNATWANLNFSALWEIETSYDYAQVLASVNNGTSWVPLCGKYTKTGSPYQDPGNPVYDGQQLNWVQEEVSLNDYLGSTIHIAFRMVSDQGLTYDGFYFDDLQVNTITSTVGIEAQKQSPILLQNIPNPATNQTTIYYSLNELKNPELKIYNVLGKLIKTELLTDKSTNTTIDLNAFENGTYFYQLSADGYRSSTKKMVVLK